MVTKVNRKYKNKIFSIILSLYIIIMVPEVFYFPYTYITTNPINLVTNQYTHRHHLIIRLLYVIPSKYILNDKLVMVIQGPPMIPTVWRHHQQQISVRLFVALQPHNRGNTFEFLKIAHKQRRSCGWWWRVDHVSPVVRPGNRTRIAYSPFGQVSACRMSLSAFRAPCAKKSSAKIRKKEQRTQGVPNSMHISTPCIQRIILAR